MKWMVTFAALTLVVLPAQAKKDRKLAQAVQAKIQEVTTTAPADNEVCFSPVERCDLKLLKFIESAEKSLDLAIYDFNLDQIGHALLIKSKKIPVRIIVDKRQSKERKSLVPMLLKAGVNLRFGRQRGIMHNKFTIVDGKRIETGSFNYTNHASQANNENQIYLSTPAIVERFKTRFEQIWDEGKVEPLAAAD